MLILGLSLHVVSPELGFVHSLAEVEGYKDNPT